MPPCHPIHVWVLTMFCHAYPLRLCLITDVHLSCRLRPMSQCHHFLRCQECCSKHISCNIIMTSSALQTHPLSMLART